jgi:hypothetical protein
MELLEKASESMGEKQNMCLKSAHGSVHASSSTNYFELSMTSEK